MNVSVLSQPFDPIGYPQTMGSLLDSLLRSRHPLFTRVSLVSAFASAASVRRLTPAILQIVTLGAQVRIVVGIDLYSTSEEALRAILDLSVDARVFKNRQPRHTFHPKLYLFEAPDQAAVLITTSSNLTEGGLYTNYEAGIRLDYILPHDIELFDQHKSSLERFLNPAPPTAQVLTADLIDLLIQRGDVLPEAQATQAQALPRPPRVPGQPPPPSPFGTEPIPPAPRIPGQRPRRSPRPAPVIQPTTPGPLLWEKRDLPPSDVQRQTGNVTGGLRLTQAGWQVNRQPIDHTTYFRNTVFGHLNWTRGRIPPRAREAVQVPFHLSIRGRDYGVSTLTVSHKPSGEAGQRNYTTMLHWGPLANTIRSLNLVGRTLHLFAPHPGQPTPYFIEIT